MTKTAPCNDRCGSRAGYVRGGRCVSCRRAWADYIRARRHKARPPDQSRAQLDLKITAAAFEKAIAEDEDADLRVRLTPLAAGILLAMQQRRGVSRSEIMDDLLRANAPA